jgi:hypothetical protein
MPIRHAKHAGEEKAIFDAFLRTHPSFAATIARTIQPNAQFPDLIVEQHDGRQVDFELVQWINEDQVERGKRREKLGKAIEAAIGEQGKNTSRHFAFVMLFPRGDIPRFQPADTAAFQKEVWHLIEETERCWPTERFWHSPQGRHVTEFDTHPTLGKYISKVLFDPLIVGKRKNTYPPGVPWIVMSAPVSSYSPETAISALREVLLRKIGGYGGLVRPVRLVVYYGMAVAYNTPWYGIHYRDFRDVAKAAAEMVKGQSRFERIYLFKALEPEPETFEVYPSFIKCS